VPDCKKATLQAIIRGRVALETVIHSDGRRGYDGLVDVGYAKHYRVNHGGNEFARGTHHVNGIESFWSFAKRRLQKFNGVPARTFHLHLNGCEWRFNIRSKNLYQELLKLLSSILTPFQYALTSNACASVNHLRGLCGRLIVRLESLRDAGSLSRDFVVNGEVSVCGRGLGVSQDSAHHLKRHLASDETHGSGMTKAMTRNTVRASVLNSSRLTR
jgi:transposase-like protein